MVIRARGGTSGWGASLARVVSWGAPAWALACGLVDDRQVEALPEQPCASAPCSAGASAGGTGGAGGGQSDVAPDAGPPAPVGVRPLGDDPVCLSTTSNAELKPAALYLMLDSSGSMLEPAGASTKWDSVRAAIRGFVTQDAELELGLQFFPQIKPGSSFTCTSHADCGADGGPCFLSTCIAGTSITLCETDADCPADPAGNACVQFGLCSGGNPMAPVACILGTGACADGLGSCDDFERTCTNATSCEPARYAAPAVEIGPAASTSSAIEQALTNQLPQGLTPTVPALQGAIDHAREWSRTHPGENVAVLLATDGLPSECGPPPMPGLPAMDSAAVIQEVQAVAASGVAGEPSVRTFVMGVFQTGDTTSIDNVNAIARAGGTEEARFIDASGAVEAQFLAGLEDVRAAATPCQVELTGADGVDYLKVDLLFDAGNGATSPVPYVENLLGCAAQPEGWYYDVPPDGATPQTVELCPNLCQLVSSAPASSLALRIGCAEAN
jgi:hypothetical protein